MNEIEKAINKLIEQDDEDFGMDMDVREPPVPSFPDYGYTYSYLVMHFQRVFGRDLTDLEKEFVEYCLRQDSFNPYVSMTTKVGIVGKGFAYLNDFGIRRDNFGPALTAGLFAM